jgi:hypothetical protein
VQGFFSFLPSQADEGADRSGVAIQEAGEGGGGLGLAVLGPGLAMALEEQEEQGFEGIPKVGAWQEGQDDRE